MFGIDAFTFPAAYTYDAVAALYDKCKPLKSDPAWRCLRSTRSNDTTGLIRKNVDKYILRLYATDMVCWTPNRVEVTRHDSKSSAGFASQYLPGRYRAGMYGNRMAIDNLHADSRWVFNKVGDEWEMDTSTLTKYSKYSLDRKVLAQMRKKATPLVEYVKARSALLQDNQRAYRFLPPGQIAALLAVAGQRVEDVSAYPRVYNTVKEVLTPDDFARELPVTLTVLAGGVVKSEQPPGLKPRDPEWFSGHRHLIST